MRDLRERVPGQALIEQLFREWDAGRIHFGHTEDEIVIEDEARGWYLGVHGERWVATRLAALGPEYTVLHSVPVGARNSDIDHVVIGPTGVFTINTKYSPGRKIWSAGYGIYVGDRAEKHFIQKLESEVRRAGERLSRACGSSAPVTGLLVFVDPAEVRRKAPAGDGSGSLQVIGDAELLSTITARPPIPDLDVETVRTAAVNPKTWHNSPAESRVGSHLLQEFCALEAAVGGVRATAPTKVKTQAARSSMPRRPVRYAIPVAAKTPRQRASSHSRKVRASWGEMIVKFAIAIGFIAWVTSESGQSFIRSVFAWMLGQ